MREVILQLKVEASSLSEAESKELWRKIWLQFSVNQKEVYPLWDNLTSYASVFNKDGWRTITNFSSEETVLFFESKDDKTIFLYKTPEDIPRVLGEMHGFVFYLTNRECDFLLCFNDHDYMIGAGEAEEWIKKYLQ